MSKYLIGEVVKLTGVKAHVLRYWESIIPGFSPQKDYRGKRLYSQREIDMIMRLKYLTQTQGLSIKAARKRMLQDAEIMEAELAALSTLHDIRSQLTDLYLMLKKTGENYNKKKQEEANARQKLREQDRT